MAFFSHTKKKRVKTPSVFQMEAVECGAAALGIILSYYHRYVSLEELRIACGVSRDGSKASHLLIAAKQYGLAASGLHLELNELMTLQPPFIVFWDFSHFLVVEGFKKNKAYLNDPAVGPRQMSLETFSLSYTGIALTFAPTPDFQPGGEKPFFIASLLRRLKDHKKTLVYLFIAGIALTIPGLAIPAFSKIFVNQCLIAGTHTWLYPLLIGMLLTACLRGGLSWLQSYYLLRFRMQLSLTSASKFFWHVLRLPQIFYSQRYAGDIANRVSINDQLAQLLSQDFIGSILNIINVVFYIVLMAVYNLTLAMTTTGIALINLWALKSVSRARIDANQRVSIEMGRLYGSLMNGIQMIETLKFSGMEMQLFSSLTSRLAIIISTLQEVGFKNQIIITLSYFLPGLNNVAILGLGGYLIMKGHMSVGLLVAFQSLATSFMNPFVQLVQLGSKLQTMQGAMNRLDDVLKYPVESSLDHPDTSDQKQLSGRVEVNNITFGYSAFDPPVLKDVSFTAAAGMWVGIVGGAHSGRSTIARLIMQLYTPTSGSIVFDDPLGISPRVLAESIGFVSQDIVFFEGTIHDNLTLWDSTIPEHQVIEAAKDAEIHDIISARSNGYLSILEEGGKNFSGGERQRLEIARALVKKPSLLILDEATSALDAPLEKKIHDNLRARGCTCLIMANRLSAIRDCDNILVLDQGTIVEQGIHSRLIARAGSLYAELVHAE